MGKIYYIVGKSSTGKDTIYKRLQKDKDLGLKNVVMYTTRPKRDGEIEGITYHYVSEEEFLRLKNQNLIIEDRSYNTIHGLWRYFTVKDENINLDINDYIIIGVLESFVATRNYFGKESVVPIYIEVEDGERLMRALKRELKPGNHKYAEMCRRFLADADDFSEERITAAGIDKRFINTDLKKCLEEIREYIKLNKY